MKSITSSRLHPFVLFSLLFLLITTLCLGFKTTNPSQQSTDIHRRSSQSQQQRQQQENDDEIEKYSSLPHTIFSSNGRLYNVEKAALKSSDDKDVSSSLVLAIKFGIGDSILVISTCPRSPYLYYNNNDNNDNDDKNHHHTKQALNTAQSKTSLWNYNLYNNNHKKTKTIIPSYPISILTPNLLIGTGGTSIDSIVLYDKILELFLSLVQSKDGMNSTHRIQGVVKSSLLARKIADSLQVYTQDVSSGYGRILSSSALVIGIDEVSTTTSNTTSNNNYNNHNLLWRIDPTGQFWNCQVAAVGRGAGLVEASMLKVVQKWKHHEQNHNSCDTHDNNDDDLDLDKLIESISHNDVEACLKAMSFDQAMIFACECIKKVHKISNRKEEDSCNMVGVQALLIETSKVEMIHPGIIRECLNSVI